MCLSFFLVVDMCVEVKGNCNTQIMLTGQPLYFYPHYRVMY
jgi:hypothetical protein